MKTTDTQLHLLHIHLPTYHHSTSLHTHLYTHITTPPPNIPTLIIQYLLLWLRGRARAECSGLGKWRFRSPCLRTEGGVTVTGVQLAVLIHWELGGSDSGLGGPTFDLSVSSSESLCWRVFWKSATRASLDRSCLSRSPIFLLLDCSCTQRDSH